MLDEFRRDQAARIVRLLPARGCLAQFLASLFVASGVLRRMTRRSGKGGSRGPNLACTITSCGNRSAGSVPRWVIRSNSVRSGRLRLSFASAPGR